MRISPLEIRQKTFERTFRGYEKEEVEAYLLTLSNQWEKLLEENRDFKVKVEILEKDVQKMREVESSLFKTLKTAEDTGRHQIDQATKTAELLLKEAQMNADALTNESKYNAKNIIEEAEAKAKNFYEEARDRVREAEKEISEIENIKENMVQDIRNTANNLIDRLEKISEKSERKKKPVAKAEPSKVVGTGSFFESL